MRFYKSETLTICTKKFLIERLEFFDRSIEADPTLITEENKVLRILLGQRVDKCIFGICFYNSRKLIAQASVITGRRTVR